MRENVGQLMNTTVYDATSCLVNVQGIDPTQYGTMVIILAVGCVVLGMFWISYWLYANNLRQFICKNGLAQKYEDWRADRKRYSE